MTPEQIRKLSLQHWGDTEEVATITGKLHTAEVLRACADVVEAAMRERCTVLPCENGCAICMAIAKLEGIAP